MKLFKSLLLSFIFLLFTNTLLSAQNKHAVKAKETLYSISKKYSITVGQLKKWNRLQSSSIAVGQVLLVTDPFLKAKLDNAQKKSLKAEIHIVKKSESLFSISKQYDVTVNELKSLNKIKKNALKIGQELIIRYIPNNDNLIAQSESRKSLKIESFETIDVTEDISIAEFALQNDIKADEVRVLNPFLKDSQLLKKGNKIIILKSIGTINENPYKTVSLFVDNEVNSTKSENQELIPTFIYNTKEERNVTTNGELINLNSFTIAHPTLPFGTLVLLKNQMNNLVVLARVNDRTTENAIKITDSIKKAIDFQPMAQMKISIKSL
ncbi:MAG: LysM peptidoglycan-binding domain-containing protein [Bacteroidetes bacterium]|nr:LysM peptidoglycan-binding domain-containing protein [Bacteroidota bacterium]